MLCSDALGGRCVGFECGWSTLVAMAGHWSFGDAAAADAAGGEGTESPVRRRVPSYVPVPDWRISVRAAAAKVPLPARRVTEHYSKLGT